MIYRSFLFLTGFGLAILGGISITAYLNLLVTGHTFYDYLAYISTRIECYLLVLGVSMIWVSIYFPPQKSGD